MSILKSSEIHQSIVEKPSECQSQGLIGWKIALYLSDSSDGK